MPHGGFGQSGYGKDLSVYALEEYTRVKHVMAKLHRGRRPRAAPATSTTIAAPVRQGGRW
jgi:hypothetical protein